MKSMSMRERAVALLVVQAALVLSIAGKYLYERKVCPRVWVRAAQYDPSLVFRGRYLALQLTVDACALPRDKAEHMGGVFNGPHVHFPPDQSFWRWNVRPVAQDGKLVPLLASGTDRPEVIDTVMLRGDRPCDRATLSEAVEYFVSDATKGPFPPGPKQELWVEVTVPPSGPPRPIELALAEDGVFTPLKLQ